MVSVIVPIYDIEKYVERCIESIINQSYADIEIILVDDGSNDSSREICENYKMKDTRINVIHKKNGGLSSARNAGLNIASGEYVMFVDGDDWIHPRAIEICTSVAESDMSDIVQFEFQNIKENEIDKVSYMDCDNSYRSKCVDRDNALGEMYVTTWSKLYKRELFSNLRFEEGRLHEDDFMFHRMMYQVNRVSFIKQKLYYYLQRNDSIMHKLTEKNYIDATDAFIDRVAFSASKKWCAGLDHGAKWGTYYYLNIYATNRIKIDKRIQKRKMREWLKLVKKTGYRLDSKTRLRLMFPELIKR